MKLHRHLLLTAGFALLVAGCVSESDDPGKTPADSTKTGKTDNTGNAGAGTAKAPDAGKKDAGTKTPEQPAGGGKDPVTPKPAGKKFTSAEYKAAKTQMMTFCSTCHGKSGKGDGAAAAALNPKPRDWTDPKWHESVTDQKIFDVVMDGGAKHGLSALMAPNPQFQGKPGPVWALVKMIRAYRPK